MNRLRSLLMFALVPLLVLMPSVAFSQTLSNITGSAWPTSGTATSATIGIDTLGGSITGTGLTHVGAASTDLWQGSTATGYISSTAGTAISLRINGATAAASGLFATPTNGDIGLSGFWVRPVRSDPTLAAFTTTASYSVTSAVYGSSPTCNLLGAVVKNGTAPEYGSGIALFVYPNTGSASVSTEGLGYVRAMNGSTSTITAGTDLVPNIPFERWTYLQIRVTLNAAGTYDLIINGQMVSRATVNTGTTDATVNNIVFTLPAWTGVQWQLGAMDSRRGTGHAAFTTQYLSPSNYDTAFVWPTTFHSNAEGDCWATSTSGTVAVGSRPMSGNIGFRDRTERLVASISSGGSLTITSKKSIGTLPYNADGWAWVWLRNIQYNASAPGLVWLDTAAGHVADIRWTAQGVVNQGTTNPVCSLSTADGVFDLGVCFNSDGRVRGLLVEKSFNYSPTTSGTRPTVHPFVLNNWTPAAMTTATVFASTTAQTTFSFGGLAVCRYLPLAGIDSFAETAHSTISYDYISYTGVTGSPVLTAGTPISGNTSGLTGQIIAAGSGAGGANNWILVYTNHTWVTDTTITVTGGTFTGCSAASKPVWIGYTSLVGTLARSDTLTETTSSATGKLLTSDVLDASYTPPGVLCVLPVSGIIRGGLTLTGTADGDTLTGDIPQKGVYIASHGSSYATKVYSNLRDASAAAVVSPFAPTDASKPAFQVGGVFGRAGKTLAQTHAGTSFGNTPALHVWIFGGGVTNALNVATTSPLAQSIARREADSLVAMAAEVTTNGGYFTWETPNFGTGFMYLQSNARECFDTFNRFARAGLADIGTGRIFVVDTGGIMASDDLGVHPNPVGAATTAKIGTTSATPISTPIKLRNRSDAMPLRTLPIEITPGVRYARAA